MSYTATDHFILLPVIMLAVFGCAVLFANRRLLPGVFGTGLVFTAFALLRQQLYIAANPTVRLSGFHDALAADRFSLFFNWLFLAASGIVAVVSLREMEAGFAEYGALLLFAQCGMFFLAGGTDLITLFLGLELMAICFYVLVGFARRDRRSPEAAIKYLILGAFSSGLLAYGFSLLYGLSGSTNLQEIAAALATRSSDDPLVILALVTAGAGLLFKISAVPFHMWAPDAYEGAPTAAAAYLAVASKAASVALLMRLILGPFASLRSLWEPMLAVVAVASMTIGNLAAIAQNNVKRLLAYSSISHAGYLLLGLIAGNETGIRGISVYLLVYTFMTLGAFLVVIAMRRRDLIGEEVADLTGLVHRSPFSAVLMLIFVLSLAGIPPTAGFLGKYYLLQSLMETGHYVLASIGTLYVVVSLYYYFRLVRVMFTSEASVTAPLEASLGLRFALGLSGALTLGIGIFPEPFLHFAEESLLR